MSDKVELSKLKVAIVHNWFWKMRGAEKCLHAFCRVFPQADIYTLFGDKSILSPQLQRHKIYFSPLHKLPFIDKFYKHTMPVWPVLTELMDFSQYDLVISSSSTTLHGIITTGETLNMSYLYTPMRYIWDQEKLYSAKQGILTRNLAKVVNHFMRIWDSGSSSRIDIPITISKFVAARARKYWRDERFHVVYPPVINRKQIRSYAKSYEQKEEYYVVVSGFEENKGARAALDFASRSGVSLNVVGDSPSRAGLEREYRKYGNITFEGWLPDDQLYDVVSRAKGLFFLGVEDFGLVPVESVLLGTPVIGYNRGGVKESIVDGVNGVLIDQVDYASLEQSLKKLDTIKWDLEKMERSIEQFSFVEFERAITQLITEEYEKKS